MADPIIEQLFELGHFYSPEALIDGLVETKDVDKLTMHDDVTKAAVRSWQLWFAQECNSACHKHHKRALVADGEIGPATFEVMNYDRCGNPDYAHPEEQYANIPEACRNEITTSYRMSLSGVSDEKLAELWQEADGYWEQEFEMRYIFRPQDFPNTRIYATKKSLGGSTLAWQTLAQNSCSSRLEGAVDNRNWGDIILVTTIAHEHGHASGMGHSNDPAATMYPMITQTSMSRRGKPNASDIRMMQAIGYKRRTTPIPPGPGPGPGPEDPTNLWKFSGTTVTHVPSGDSVTMRIIEDSGF